jgi:hypothetical protein
LATLAIHALLNSLLISEDWFKNFLPVFIVLAAMAESLLLSVLYFYFFWVL